MTNSNSNAASVPNEIALLVARLHDTQQGLQKLAGGQLDAVVHAGGYCYLLHEAQERLQKSEATQNAAAAMQAAILDSLPANIALLNHEGVIISVNKGWRSFATCNALEGSESGLGQNYLKICEGAYGSCSDEAFEAAVGIRKVLNNIVPQFSMDYLCDTGVERKWFRLNVSPIGESCQGGAVVMHVDITQQKLAAEELRESTSRMREQARLLDIAHDAIHVENLDSQIIYWNQGAERICGWSAAEAVGRIADELLLLDSIHSKEVLKALISKGEWNGETTKQTKDGRKIIVEVHRTLVRDEAGNPKSILAIDTDITERKQLENQFLRAQRLESIGTLASGLAHDLNNMLSPILMSVPMLRGELSDRNRDKLLTAIQSSAERGAKIIGQVLTFGRGIQGERLPIHIAPIIEEIAQVASETFPKNIRIETRIADGLFHILGDATQCQQVLMNLAVNARDAMPDGGILRLTAEYLNVDAQYASMIEGLAAGPHIAIEVSDSGTGIPPEVAERIFDPFFTTKAVGKGTGLGLSTVLGIVKSHGGVITLTSRPGLGTIFRILVPVLDAGVAAVSGEPNTPIPMANGKTVLVVDDENHLRFATRTVLEKHGYRTFDAADGIEALAIYAQHSAGIDAILTDITMPVMDGAALIRTLQEMRPGVTIIATTGSAERLPELAILGVTAVLH